MEDNSDSIGSSSLSLYIRTLVACSVIWLCLSYTSKHRYLRGVPFISSDIKGPQGVGWSVEGVQMVMKGLKSYSGIFQVMSGTGPLVVLPNRFIDEVRNHKDLSFNRYFDKDFFIKYPGFEAYHTCYRDGSFIQEVVRTKLTQSLGLVTKDLVEEMSDATHDLAGEDTTFHEITAKTFVSQLVARLSSRVFLGKKLARNQRWLEIAVSYTHDSYSAAYELRQWPFLARPFIHWFLPKCRRLRQEVKDATKLIMPEVEERKQVVTMALAAGTKPPKKADTIGWMYEVSRGRDVNYVHGQLFLSFAAIHTTTETITGCLYDICAYPEIVQPLRDEIIQVLSKNGWAKTSLYKLKLMDSFMKESQRRHAMGTTSIHRYVDNDILLSDGTLLRKGYRVMVSASPFMDPNVYPDPEKYDIYRFLHLRSQEGKENTNQYVTTSPEYLLFGHGTHACPGRFFASNEMKIALCHLLLKYDWKLGKGQTNRPEHIQADQGFLANPVAKVMMRRRKEEIDLDTVTD